MTMAQILLYLLPFLDFAVWVFSSASIANVIFRYAHNDVSKPATKVFGLLFVSGLYFLCSSLISSFIDEKGIIANHSKSPSISETAGQLPTTKRYAL